MSEQKATRTLLKSPPELWAECSDPQSLARHLDTFFGEIRVTRLEPESTVAWEGDRGSGTVRIEPAGWGTRVTLTARSGTESGPAAHKVGPPAPDGESASPKTDQGLPGGEDGRQGMGEHPDPPPVVFSRPSLRPTTFFARLLRRFGTGSHPARPEPAAPRPEAGPAPPRSSVPEPPPAAEPEPPPAAESEPPRGALDETAEVLVAALDSLGGAHHRPFSRA